MKVKNPIRSVFLIVGLATMALVIAAGFWSNQVYEQQFLQDHQRRLQENARLIASILETLPAEKEALLIIRDLVHTLDHNNGHLHRVVVQDNLGSDILVFPYNIGTLAFSASTDFSGGSVALYSAQPHPSYPSQLFVLAALGVFLVLIIGIGMNIAGHALQQPLHALATAANRFAQGDLEYRTAPEDHPLVHEIATTMNQMAEQLQSRIDTILSQQQELEALFASMVEGIIVLSENGRVQRINSVAASFFGTKVQDACGKPLLQILRSPAMEDLISRCSKTTAAVEQEIQVFSPQQLLLQAHASRYQSGEKIGILLVLHDITEIRRLETVRRDFVSNVSHELKTPVTSISGFAETILDDPEMPAEQCTRFIQIINKQASRLQSIIEDLLSLSRIEEHGRELPRESMKTRPLLEGVINLCRFAAEEKEIELELEQDDPGKIHANANLLEQALFNLVQNAIKYSPNKSRVILRSQQLADAPQNIQFEVQDFGTGIPQQDIPRLFERFYRVDRARSRELGGTGLGLAIVKHIALVHGGTVDVESTLGNGSSFRLTIPR